MNHVRLAAVGDIMLAEDVSVGFGIRTNAQRFGWQWPFEKISKELSKADLLVGNLEAALAERGQRGFDYNSVIFRSDPGAASALAELGFRAVSIANNHILQHGRKVFWDTIRLIRRAGMSPVGLSDKNGGSLLEIQEVYGQWLGFLGYSLWPSEKHEEDNDVFSMVRGREKIILDNIETYSNQVNHLIVCIHWGYEYVHHPTEDQIELGHAMIEAGARCVLGHHPHVLQGVEKWKNGLIAYSLGNFIFDMIYPMCRRSIVLEITLSSGKVEDYQICPIQIGSDFRPKQAEGRNREKIYEDIKEYNRRIVDASFSSERKKKACKEISVNHKIIIQKSRDRFFLNNFYRYPWRFIVFKLFYKIRNVLLLRYRRKQYKHDIFYKNH